MIEDQRRRWNALTQLLNRSDVGGFGALSVSEVKLLCRLYRQVSIDLSQARTSGADPDLVHYLNNLAARAHGRVYAAKPVDVRPALTFLTRGFPRLVRRRSRPILISVGLLVLSSLASFLAVVRDPELAYSMFDERTVEFENVRLEKQEGEYRGNFTFDVTESPQQAAFIIGNNITVAVRTFALGSLFCLPGALSILYNGRMLGTLSGLVWNYGYFIGFYSLILTHGVLELTAICIAGGAGLMMGWALISPGPLPRRDSLRRAASDAFGLLGGTVAMLIFAGIIEAHVTPHFPAPVRWSVAGASALFLIVYFGWVGRKPDVASELTEGRESQSGDSG